jgi:GT2 family glycosyltransferase
MTAPTVAVVICAYTLDRWDELCASIASAARQTPRPEEILLVVDHNDVLLQRAQREVAPEQPLLRVVANSRKQGLSGARNTALEEVSAEVVVFLDDDATAEDGWLAALLTHYDRADVIAVGGVATPRWPSGEHRPVTLPTEGPTARGELDWVVGCTYAGQPTTAQPVRNLMGCNMSFRREVFATVGGFSEDLGRVGKTPLGCEETELCIRARRAYPGTEIIFEPRAGVQHQVSTDRLSWGYLRRRCYAEGLSKAAVSGLVGSDQALETERGYALRVLPRGLWRELRHAATRSGHRRTDLAGAAAIVLGLAETVRGYARARATQAKLSGTAPALEVR